MRRAAHGSSAPDGTEPRVVIVDLGTPPEPDGVGTATGSTAPRTRRLRRFSGRARAGVCGVVLVALVGIAGDSSSSSGQSGAGTTRPDVCEVIRAQEDRLVTGSFGPDTVSGFPFEELDDPGILGAAVSSTVAMWVYQADVRTGQQTLLAFADSNELWEFCIASTEAEVLGGSSYPDEDELGELPDGMKYVYRKDGMPAEYEVAGIRLSDGSVVDSLTLRDGRTLPLDPGAG